jgi:hypothetical protein
VATLLVAVTAVLGSLVGVVLAPAGWLGALETSGAYEQAPDAIADQLLISYGAGGRTGSLGPLEPADVRALVAAAAPPAWLREQAAAVVPPLVERLATTGEIGGTISLAPLKARLAGAPVQAAAVARIATWPTCTATQLQQLVGGTLQRCQPPAGFEGQIAVAVGALFGSVASRLPDEIEVARLVPGTTPLSGPGGSPPSAGATPLGDEPGRGGADNPLRAVAAARPLVTAMVLVIVLVVAAATLASGLTLRALLGSVAIPLLGGGLLAVAVGWLAAPWLEAAADSARGSVTSAGGATALSALGGAVAGALVDQGRSRIVESGVLLAAVGAALLVFRGVAFRR